MSKVGLTQSENGLTKVSEKVDKRNPCPRFYRIRLWTWSYCISPKNTPSWTAPTLYLFSQLSGMSSLYYFANYAGTSCCNCAQQLYSIWHTLMSLIVVSLIKFKTVEFVISNVNMAIGNPPRDFIKICNLWWKSWRGEMHLKMHCFSIIMYGVKVTFNFWQINCNHNNGKVPIQNIGFIMN